MAVGQCDFPQMPEITGIELGTTCAGIKQNVRDDVLVIQMSEQATCAAVFTQNAFCAAPVHVAKANLAHAPRWLLINSGNANAGTGAQGMQDALSTCASLAEVAGGLANQVLPFSTGVIGQPLPVAKIQPALPAAVKNLSTANWAKAAQAIMTTDTFPKGASKVISIDGQTISINGISKGAGMIQPNMATMLGFIATDAAVSQPVLDHLVKEAADQSFNCITIDGDTSTNDSFMLIATGAAEVEVASTDSAEYAQLSAAVISISQELAQMIVRDGEGATKFITITVEQGESVEECRKIAYSIGHSPLVKTAFFASDPNLGRILAAIGYAGVDDLDVGKLNLYLDDVWVAKNGGRHPDYQEVDGQRVMKQSEIAVRVTLGRGDAAATIWTCDLSHEYVTINADYRS